MAQFCAFARLIGDCRELLLGAITGDFRRLLCRRFAVSPLVWGVVLERKQLAFLLCPFERKFAQA